MSARLQPNRPSRWTLVMIKTLEELGLDADPRFDLEAAWVSLLVEVWNPSPDGNEDEDLLNFRELYLWFAANPELQAYLEGVGKLRFISAENEDEESDERIERLSEITVPILWRLIDERKERERWAWLRLSNYTSGAVWSQPPWHLVRGVHRGIVRVACGRRFNRYDFRLNWASSIEGNDGECCAACGRYED